MKQDEVQIGMTARVKIGPRLAEVTVLRRLDGRGRARFECRTADTNKLIRATAARLRPLPGGRTMAASGHGDPAVSPAASSVCETVPKAAPATPAGAGAAYAYGRAKPHRPSGGSLPDGLRARRSCPGSCSCPGSSLPGVPGTSSHVEASTG